MRVVAFLIVLALAGCGIDGAPSQPGPAPTVSGEAKIGVVGDV